VQHQSRRDVAGPPVPEAHVVGSAWARCIRPIDSRWAKAKNRNEFWQYQRNQRVCGRLGLRPDRFSSYHSKLGSFSFTPFATGAILSKGLF
jgi:hypothetical protein